MCANNVQLESAREVFSLGLAKASMPLLAESQKKSSPFFEILWTHFEHGDASMRSKANVKMI